MGNKKTTKEKSPATKAPETPIPSKDKGAKRGPKGRPDGFKAECYAKINKGIDRNTELVVIKQRYRLGDGSNVFPGGKFKAHQMDARVIRGAMDNYHIMPAKKAPKKGERRVDYVSRMMAEYEPGVEPSSCKDKK